MGILPKRRPLFQEVLLMPVFQRTLSGVLCPTINHTQTYVTLGMLSTGRLSVLTVLLQCYSPSSCIINTVLFCSPCVFVS